ncbi:hypothetical protein [Nocardiopsis sp. CNT312]|uniref:hypothetical protein n=1 Tax=Nocardiopsis sp. CNT312 TaxID=1137268 RepID=UPI000490DAAD|nr:hypothetical protein [Nocardiopsis sp. CNT312]
MATDLDTGRPARNLTTPDLLAIASVIVGRMDQDADYMPYVRVGVSTSVIGLSIEMGIDQRPGKASHTQGAAFLNDLAQAVNTPVYDPQNFHIAFLSCPDWEGAGVQVHAQAAVRDEKSA